MATFKCLGNDGERHDVTWLLISKAYLPAISVCTQKLVPVLRNEAPVDGEAMTLEIVTLNGTFTDGSQTDTLTPNAGRTVYKFTNQVSGSITINVDPSNCELGDEIVLMFKIDTSATFLLPEEVFCFENGENAYELSKERWVFMFTFDGDRFVGTYENC